MDSCEHTFYDRIINAYPGSVLVTDRHGIILFASRGTMELTNRTQEELVGWSVYELVRQKVFSQSVLAASLKSGQVETRYLTINGDHSRGILAIGVPLFDAEGAITHVVAFSQGEAFAKEYYNKLELEKQQIKRGFSHILDSVKKMDFIAESPKTKELFHFADTISTMAVTVLITGESGTGKEVLARHIYKCSMVAKEIFIAINCAAIPENLMESEFFWYEKGAFTGADKNGKPGLFELSNGGTLFLDEIGELSLNMQSKLLRVLESGEFKRLGSNEIKTSNVRIIAATNQNLLEMVGRGRFRDDLYYRLNVLPLRLPPLRERPEDLLVLIEFFLAKYNQKHNQHMTLDKRTLSQLTAYSWPGNVRELKNVVERLVITSGQPIAIGESDFISAPSPSVHTTSVSSTAPPDPRSSSVSYKTYMEQSERCFLTHMLEQCHGNVQMVAQEIGLHISGVYRKLEKYCLDPRNYKGGPNQTFPY